MMMQHITQASMVEVDTLISHAMLVPWGLYAQRIGLEPIRESRMNEKQSRRKQNEA